jgi:hypothetical protein
MGTGRSSGGFNSIRLYAFTNFTTTPTIGAVQLLLDQSTKVTYGKDDKAVYTLNVDSIKNDSDIHSKLRSWIQISTAGLEDVTFTDGSYLAGASINTNLFCISDGAIDVGPGSPSSGKRQFYAGAVAVKNTSGGYDEEAKKWTRVKFEVVSIPLNAAFTIPTTYFPTTVYTAAAAYTISATDKYGVIDFM